MLAVFIGLDLATSVFQVHGVDAQGKVVVTKRLRRDTVLAFFATLAPCVVGMEACAGSHFWAREITRLGHTVRLMAPQYVKAYVKRQKNDRADAEAICEAVQRPSMRFVAVKTEEQQSTLAIHRVRETEGVNVFETAELVIQT
jgi:transposase